MTYENTVYGNAYNPVADLDVSEYTLLEKVHTMNAIFDTWPALYPRMQGVDLRTRVRRLEVPVYFVQGAQEMRGLADLFTPWYDALQAPAKHLDVLDPAGHRAIFEQPDRFAAIMARVLAET
jgi:pimeloyl-ACP methyl ester carboxylesterase